MASAGNHCSCCSSGLHGRPEALHIRLLLVIADVAGGQGELAFELLNLNGIPATVLEPRQLELHKRCKRLLVSLRAAAYCTDGIQAADWVAEWMETGLRTGHLLPQAL